MEWIERLNSAIEYIEENLSNEIDYSNLSKIACCSTHHFQRMFSYMADVSLSEYIRRRRMSMAAVDLQGSDAKIIDTALKYGYDSPTSFNRAFQSVHGVAPSLAKKDGISLKSFPPMSFKLTIKGVAEMEYRIEKREAFRIVGVADLLEKEIEKNFETVPKMWQKAVSNGTLGKLASMMDNPEFGILGVSVCNDREDWRYFIAVASDRDIDDTLEEYIVPASSWAVFSGTGNGKSIQELEKKIVTDWLPGSGYEYADAPDLEAYLSDDPENMKYEVWLPVVKKTT